MRAGILPLLLVALAFAACLLPAEAAGTGCNHSPLLAKCDREGTAALCSEMRKALGCAPDVTDLGEDLGVGELPVSLEEFGQPSNNANEGSVSSKRPTPHKSTATKAERVAEQAGFDNVQATVKKAAPKKAKKKVQHPARHDRVEASTQRSSPGDGGPGDEAGPAEEQDLGSSALLGRRRRRSSAKSKAKLKAQMKAKGSTASLVKAATQATIKTVKGVSKKARKFLKRKPKEGVTVDKCAMLRATDEPANVQLVLPKGCPNHANPNDWIKAVMVKDKKTGNDTNRVVFCLNTTDAYVFTSGNKVKLNGKTLSYKGDGKINSGQNKMPCTHAAMVDADTRVTNPAKWYLKGTLGGAVVYDQTVVVTFADHAKKPNCEVSVQYRTIKVPEANNLRVKAISMAVCQNVKNKPGSKCKLRRKCAQKKAILTCRESKSERQAGEVLLGSGDSARWGFIKKIVKKVAKVTGLAAWGKGDKCRSYSKSLAAALV